MNNYEPVALLDDSLSSVFYEKADCVNNKYLDLQASWYKSHFGEQIINSITPEDYGWKYPEPGSLSEGIIKQVCKYAGQQPSDATSSFLSNLLAYSIVGWSIRFGLPHLLAMRN